MPPSDKPEIFGDDLHMYAGRWIALVDGQIVGQGGTPEQALSAARTSRFKETPQIRYVSFGKSFSFPPEYEKVLANLPTDSPVYLVGGAVRDMLLDHPVHDMDFILPREAIKISRKLANATGAAFFPLDIEHDTARLVFIRPDGSRLLMDFAAMRGPGLESDLKGRDFTINAIAANVQNPQELLDPLGGMADLLAKQLKPCSPNSFIDDPVRILRAVRLASGFSLRISPETRKLMRGAAALLPGVSPERLRDELFRILAGGGSSSALRALEILGALHFVLPEMADLKGFHQPPPHVLDVWNHTLDVLNKLEALLEVLQTEYDPEKAANLTLGMAVLRLGRYRQQISHHINTLITPERSLRPLLFLASLYHDVAKPRTRQVDESGRVRFYHHDDVGAQMAEARGRSLRLSNLEINRLQMIVNHHMRPLSLAQSQNPPTRRAIFRFYRDLGAIGIDVCLLSLADTLATYGATLPQDYWIRHLDVVRHLFEAWWEKPEESVSPTTFINGHDLITGFHLSPGPQIGVLLEAVREAQAVGQIQTRDEALEWIEDFLKNEERS